MVARDWKDERMETDNEYKVSFVADENTLKLMVIQSGGGSLDCSTGLEGQIKG